MFAAVFTAVFVVPSASAASVTAASAAVAAAAVVVAAAAEADRLELELNAGHDLDSQNLATFLTIPKILEMSIGHVLTVECIEEGMPTVVARYLDICKGSA